MIYEMFETINVWFVTVNTESFCLRLWVIYKEHAITLVSIYALAAGVVQHFNSV